MPSLDLLLLQLQFNLLLGSGGACDGGGLGHHGGEGRVCHYICP
jgi:hypothetical protein